VNIHRILLLRVSSTVDKDVDHPQFFDPPYALKYLEAGLKANSNLTVNLLDCWIHPKKVSEMLDYAEDFHPDLVVVSASSFDIEIASDFVSSLKKKEPAPLVIGVGQGFYADGGIKKEQSQAYDAILLAEVEQEFFRLFEQIQSNGQPDASWRKYYRQLYESDTRFVVEDPDNLPFPSYIPEELQAYRSIYPIRLSQRVVWGFLIATRGCPHNCEFCSEVMRVSTGKKLRGRSAKNIADEMEHLAQQGVNICSFQDDSFSANRKLVKELCEELIARKSTMPWMARVRVDELDYDRLVLMKKAGCVMLGVGVESGSERIIKLMRKTRHPEGWIEHCRQILKWTRELGIGTNAYYVIGSPTETREEIEQTIQLALELNSDSIQVHFYTPYPGSSAWETYKDQLSEDAAAHMFHYAKPVLSVAEVSPDELVKLSSKFYQRYLFRPGFALSHLWHYAGFYAHNPDILWTLLGIRKIILKKKE